MSITPAPQSPLFCCSLCLPLGVTGLRVLLVVDVDDVNDIFLCDGCARLIIERELVAVSIRLTARSRVWDVTYSTSVLGRFCA